MFEFAEVTKDMTASEILNYYRNLYYAEPQVTERGIVANAINDFFADVVPKSEYDEKVIEYAILDQECGKFKAENEKLQGDLIVWKQDRFNLYQRLECYEMARQKVAREIFEELARKSTYVFPTRLYTIAKRDVDELEKKYLGGVKNAEKNTDL